MVPVFFRQHDFVRRNPPVDGQFGVVPCQRTLGLRCIVVVALVLEDRFFREHRESVGESAGDEELTVILFGEFHGDVAAECGRTAPDVDRYIEHTTLDDTHQLRLGMGCFLEMQAAQNAVRGFRFVVLHEIYGPNLFAEVTFGERFEEITALIAEQTRFDDDHAVYGCFDYFHCVNPDFPVPCGRFRR